MKTIAGKIVKPVKSRLNFKVFYVTIGSLTSGFR